MDLNGNHVFSESSQETAQKCKGLVRRRASGIFREHNKQIKIPKWWFVQYIYIYIFLTNIYL